MGVLDISEATQHDGLMVFDWHKAAKLIKKKKATYAHVHLEGSEVNNGWIFYDGSYEHDEVGVDHLASTWATPMLEIGDEDAIPCFIISDRREGGWDANTMWPDSAKKIIGK